MAAQASVKKAVAAINVAAPPLQLEAFEELEAIPEADGGNSSV